MFLYFVPIPNTYLGWGQHFLLTLVFDMTKAVANPAVLFGLWVKGDMPSLEVVIRLFSNLLVSFIGYHIVQIIYPSFVFLGPTMHADVVFAFLVEFILGFLLMLIVGLSAKFGGAVLVGIGVRVLLIIEGGRFTGYPITLL